MAEMHYVQGSYFDWLNHCFNSVNSEIKFYSKIRHYFPNNLIRYFFLLSMTSSTSDIILFSQRLWKAIGCPSLVTDTQSSKALWAMISLQAKWFICLHLTAWLYLVTIICYISTMIHWALISSLILDF